MIMMRGRWMEIEKRMMEVKYAQALELSSSLALMSKRQSFNEQSEMNEMTRGCVEMRS
jgi:hypothetical protein